MKWFRFYNEALDDPKVQRLPAPLFKTWVNFLCIASRYDGRLPGLEDMAFALRVDTESVAASLADLHQRGLIDASDGGYSPHNWDRRQPPSETPAAVAERKRQQRERDRAVTGTELPRDSAPASRPSHGDIGVTAPEMSRPRLKTKDDRQETETKDTDAGADAPVAAGAAAASEGTPVSSVKPAPKPNKYGEVIDALKAAGIDVTTTKADAGAVKDCSAPAALIAEAYGAAYRGDWPPGESWLRNNLNLQAVCKRVDGFKAFKEGIGGGAQTRQGRAGRPDGGRAGGTGDAGNPELAEYQRREEQRGLAALAEARRRRAGAVVDS